MAERAIGGDEEPSVVLGFYHRAAGGLAKKIGIEVPRYRVRAALRPGERNRGRARLEENLVLLADDFGDRKRDRGIGHVGDRVYPIGIDPAARCGGSDIGFILMIGRERFDIEPAPAAAKSAAAWRTAANEVGPLVSRYGPERPVRTPMRIGFAAACTGFRAKPNPPSPAPMPVRMRRHESAMRSYRWTTPVILLLALYILLSCRKRRQQ